ncbi:MAG: leucyl aminopeptidase family protein [Candidatus Gracilibacteria bacterium]|nr:leucyl aminopeptidase family protein [Candidatus Gracilibacteria bacterium]
MLNILKSFTDAKKSNLVILIKNKFDLENYNFLNLENSILLKIDNIFEEQKNTFLKVYTGKDDFEEIIFLFYLDIKKDIFVFLGENIDKIPEKIIFSYNKDNILLDSIILGKYDYIEYKSEKKELELNVVCEDSQIKNLTQRLATLKNITDNRDLVNKPSCDKTPDKYVQIIKNIKFKNTKIKVIDYEEIKRLGLNLIEAVGRASNYKPRLVILERIVDKKLPTIGLVGKGITFDTGGLHIKPENHMDDMKIDMAGSSTLLWTMKEIDEKEIKCNIICALPIAENSISGDAFRPGDIIKSYCGKTVEIVNTDAEGRLVLADSMSYISKNYKLESITTVATLTGACIYALGYNYAGIMGNNRQFIDNLLNNETFEKYWELPFGDFYIEKTKGKISDLVNITELVYTGCSMGGAFLANFVLNNERFTHIDMVGPGFVKEKYGLYNVGATGFGVDSLSKMILNYGK